MLKTWGRERDKERWGVERERETGRGTERERERWSINIVPSTLLLLLQ